MKAIEAAKIIVGVFNCFKQDSAVIAGGYVRDLQVGRKSKDVDIIVQYSDQSDFAEVTILADRLGYTVDKFEHYHYGDEPSQCEDNPSSEFLKCVFKLSKGDEQIDIIFVTVHYLEHIAKFPANSAMCWLKDGRFQCLPPFEDFIRHNKIRVLYQYDEYAERMEKYFPHCSVELAEEI